MSAWLDRLRQLPADSDNEYPEQSEALEVMVDLWPLLVATIQAADRWNGAGTDREDGQRAWVEITGSLTALRAKVEKLS